MSLETVIHPTLLLSLSDHLHRATHNNDMLFGFILGKTKESSTSLLYSFEIPPSEYNNKTAFCEHLNLLGEVYGKGYLKLVGFYIIDNNTSNSNFNKQISVIKNQIHLLHDIKKRSSLIDDIDLDSLLFLHLNNGISHSDLNTKITVFWLNNDKLSKLKFKIKYMEAEKITLSTYDNTPKIPTLYKESSDNNRTQLELQALNEKLTKALIFLDLIKSNPFTIYQSHINDLSDLAGQISSMKSIHPSDNSLGELDDLIAISSLTSSLFRQNLHTSI